MAHAKSALYSPYGAYELKRTYQRNFMMGTLSALSLVVLILLVSWIIKAMEDEEVIAGAPILIQTV